MITRRSFATGLLASAAVSATHAQERKPRLCVFGIGGQSNALGMADAAQSPKIPVDVMAFHSGKIVRGGDPAPLLIEGSPWPAFGIAFHEKTKLPLMFVQCARDGGFQTSKAHALAAGSGEHWDEGGTKIPFMFSTVDAAMAAASAVGYDARLCGVLWSQGEGDAGMLVYYPKDYSAAEYKAGLVKMIARLRAKFSPTLPFFIFRTGSVYADGPAKALLPGYAAVRAAQEEVAREVPNVIIASRLAVEFAKRRQLLHDVHYDQDANNEIGRDGALKVAASRLWDRWPKPQSLLLSR